MATSLNGILSQFLTTLRADTSITDLLASVTVGATTSRANSIFYGSPSRTPNFPCISLRDFGPYPLRVDQHDYPMAAVRLVMEVSIFGRSQDVRPIQREVDQLLEYAANANAMDTADWHFEDIDTADNWSNVAVPKEMTVDGSVQGLEQRTKGYTLVCADKGTL